MSPALLFPLLASLLAAVAAVPLLRRLHPALATWGLTLVAGLSAVAVLGGISMVLLATVHPLVAQVFERCFHAMSHHGEVPVGEGAVAGAWLGIATVRAHGCLQRSRALRPRESFPNDLEVLSNPQPLAFTLPGPNGRIVVSTAMLDELSPPEQAVLMEHERSHLRHRHDRFVLAAQLSESLLPLGSWLSARVRHATERWADQDAVASVGDRRLTARAITRAALVQSRPPQPALALAGIGVRARVEELLDESRQHAATGTPLALAVVSLGFVAAAAGLQIHHLALEAVRLCLT